MAQVTESLLREYERALDNRMPPLYTENEFRQLIHAHRQRDCLRTVLEAIADHSFCNITKDLARTALAENSSADSP